MQMLACCVYNWCNQSFTCAGPEFYIKELKRVYQSISLVERVSKLGDKERAQFNTDENTIREKEVVEKDCY